MIEAHELTKRYGDTTAVHSLSFTTAPGTVEVVPWSLFFRCAAPFGQGKQCGESN